MGCGEFIGALEKFFWQVSYFFRIWHKKFFPVDKKECRYRHPQDKEGVFKLVLAGLLAKTPDKRKEGRKNKGCLYSSRISHGYICAAAPHQSGKVADS